MNLLLLYSQLIVMFGADFIFHKNRFKYLVVILFMIFSNFFHTFYEFSWALAVPSVDMNHYGVLLFLFSIYFIMRVSSNFEKPAWPISTFLAPVMFCVDDVLIKSIFLVLYFLIQPRSNWILVGLAITMLATSLNESSLLITFENTNAIFASLIIIMFLITSLSEKNLRGYSERDELFFFTTSMGLAFGSMLFSVNALGVSVNVMVAVILYLLTSNKELKTRYNSLLFLMCTMISTNVGTFYPLLVLCAVYMFFMLNYTRVLTFKRKALAPLINSFMYFGITLFTIMFITTVFNNFYLLLCSIPVAMMMLRDIFFAGADIQEYCLSKTILGVLVIIGTGVMFI
jgi:hypothetical protein